MKQGWEYKKLGEVCEVLYGYPFDSNCFTTDKNCIPLIRIRDVMRGYSETYYNGKIPEGYTINEGDYLVGMDGEFNIGKWGKTSGLLNQRVCKMASSSPLLLNQFMYYFMKICLKKIENETPFVTVKHLSAKRINQILIPLPPLAVQESIVRELDEINNLIHLKKEQIKDLDSLAQSLFYEMFGDPVTNEKGWEIKKLGEVTETTSGGTPSSKKSEYYKDGNIPWLRSGEVSQGFITETGMFITEEGLKNSSARYVPINSVAIAMYGATVGQVGIIKKKMTTNQAICSIFPCKQMSPMYLMYFMRQMKPHYLKLAVGGAQPNISQTIIKSSKIPLPPLALQQSFAERVEAIEKMKTEIKSAIADLETLLASRMQHWFD